MSDKLLEKTQQKSVSVPSPEQLVDSHLPLVRNVAYRVSRKAPQVIETEDLIQIGTIALIEASRRFVSRDGATFAAYALMRVRGAMIDYLRRVAPVGRAGLLARRTLADARAAAEAEHHRPATSKEVADKLGYSQAAYMATMNISRGYRVESLEDTYSDYTISFADEQPDAFEQLSSSNLRNAVMKELHNLPQRESEVLELYFIKEMQLHEIGEHLGVGAARICQIKRNALERLRERLSRWQEGEC